MTFGAESDVHMKAHFTSDLNTPPTVRFGVQVNNDGLVEVFGAGSPLPVYSTFDLAQDMAGQSITFLAKLDYDVDRNTGGYPNNDTLMNIWVNPTDLSVEGSGITAGDMYNIRNSAGFFGFLQSIENQNTPGTAGDSLIINTKIFTGADATWENALGAAIPEPSTAILAGLGLAGVCMRRRRK